MPKEEIQNATRHLNEENALNTGYNFFLIKHFKPQY